MNATVKWDHGLTFWGQANSGFSLKLGGSKAAGGDDDGMGPMEAILIGLIACTGMDVISILQKKRQKVTGFEVRASATQADTYPKVFTHILIEYLVTGEDIKAADVERAMELSRTKYCPAQAMLGQVVPIEMKYEIVPAS